MSNYSINSNIKGDQSSISKSLKIISEKNKKGRVSIFSKRNDLQIKTYKDINSDISKMIRK